MTNHSEHLGDLAAALAKAQAAFPPVDLDGTGQVGQNRNYKYATLAHIIKTLTPTLNANGLSVIQTCEPSGAATLRVTTTLLHDSGQYLAGTAEVPLPNNTPQGYGSAMTYARRYQLSAILGIAADDDDDGKEASREKSPPRARTEPPAARAAASGPSVAHAKATPTTASEVARRWFFAKVKEEHGVTPDEAKVLLEIRSFTEDMPDATFEQILTWIGRAKLDAARVAQ